MMVKGHRAPERTGLRAAPAGLALALAAALPALAQQAVPAPAATPTAPAAPAQPARPALVPLPPAPDPVFAIRGFQVTGENPLVAAETAAVLAPYLRSDATMSTLQDATGALEKALRDKGYGLHRVALPPQEVGATIKLEIVTFHISRVEIEGRSIYSEDNIRRTLPELKEGSTPNFKRLAVQTAIANENPNKQVQVGIREGDEPDKINAGITVKESRPWTFAVSASNLGSDSSGRDRLTVTGGHTNLFDRDHAFNAAYTTSIEKPGSVKQFGLTYRVPVYELGGVVGATYTDSNVVGNFGSFTSTGAGRTFALNYTHYLPPEGGRRTYVVAGLEDKVFDAAQIDGSVVPGAFDRRSRPVVLGYNSRTETETAVWGWDASVVANTGTGFANDLRSYQSEDPRISSVHWTALRGGANYVSPFAGGWLLGVRTQFQYSPDVLIAGEQFGLGGTGSVRGTEVERPLSADKGISASAEVTTPELAPGLRVLGFVDAGWVTNNRPNGTTKPASDRLSSAGVGLRYGTGPFAFTVDYGRLLNSSNVPLSVNGASPRRGDERVYVNLSVRF
jgi:hemolysin activation/secretion protein